MSTHELARLTADVVAFAWRDGSWHVLMVQRRWDPYRGQWALPGGHVDVEESFRDAAMRELAEETGVTVAAAELRQVGIYDHPGRDPRGRYVNVAFFAELPEATRPRAGDDAAAAQWRDLDTALGDSLAFDHDGILRDAVAALAALRAAREDA
ncbi:NUDIX domain-containing protein [Amycolatopsis sp. NPDC059090]|uniref:NUDIX domain-containing protein n=2 Tax=unclassified Amycolatopsis TaxID=2618356 RepID=UPI00366D41F7